MAAKKSTKKRKVVRKPAKKTVRKTTKKAKKASAKVAKKPAVKKAAKKVEKHVVPVGSNPTRKSYTKTELYRLLAAHAGVSKQEVAAVFDGLGKVIHNHMRNGGVGLLKLEGLLKIERIHKPAKKARKGVNPFTGEEMMFKAKPAHNIIKVRTLKKLKQMVK